MKKTIKIIGIVAGIFVLLLIVLAVSLPFILNPNHYKDRIERLVQEKTGRELNIQGDIKLSIFPWLGVEIGPVQLANAEGFGSTPFAAVNETDVHVRFWPLLHGRIEVGDVKLDGLNLDLERSAEGKTNWQDILRHLSSGKQKKKAQAAAPSGPPTNLDNLSVAGVSVTDSSVRWTDAKKHQQYTISNFEMTLGSFVPAKPVSLETDFDFSGTNPTVQGHADFRGSVTADLDGSIYSSDDSKLVLTATGEVVPGGKVEATLHWKHVAANMESDTLVLNGLEAGAYGADLTVEAQGKNITQSPQFTGSVKLQPFAPRDVLKALGKDGLLDTRDSSAFKRASASLAFVASPAAVSLTDLDFVLDQTHVTGKAAIKDLKTQALTFDVNVDQLDADGYLPPPQPATPEKPREAVDIDKVGLPLRTLRSLNLDGHLHVGQFTLMNAVTRDFDMTVSAHDGKVRINPLSASLYNGTLTGDLQVDASADSPATAEKLALKGVQVGDLLKDVAKIDRLSGAVDVDTDTRAFGRTVGEMRHTLGGHIKFAVKKGTLEGINVWDSIARAYAKLKGQPAPPPAPNRTEFADVHGTGTITKGVLFNKDFTALMPFMAVTGAGKVDLAGSTVDYDLKGRITGSPQLGSNQDLSGLKGLTVPIHIGGTFSNLSVRPELGGIIKGKAEELLNKQKSNLKEKAKDKLKDLLKGGGGGGE